MPQIKENMGLLSCVGLIVGACVGSAIFSLSGITILYAGASAILSWVIAAVIYGMYGVLVSRLALQFPRSGGIYVFPRLAIGGNTGRLLGFMSGWGYVISNIIAIAFSATYLGVYLNAGFPQIPAQAATIISLFLTFGVLMFNGRSSQCIQDILVGLLVAVLLFFCVVAFGAGSFEPAHFDGFFSGGVKGTTGFINAIPLAMVAYGGCVAIAFVASEVRNPVKNVKRSLFLGLGLVVILYVAFLAAIIGTLPLEVLRDNEQIRYIPAFASVMMGSLSAYPYLVKVISACGAVALLTTVIALTRINARAIQAISWEGLLPRHLGYETTSGRPVNAYFLILCVCLTLCLFHVNMDIIINLGAVMNIVSMVITCVAAYFLSRKKLTVPYRGMFPAIVAVLLCACYVPDIIGGRSDMWMFTAVAYALAIVTFLICRHRSSTHVEGIVVHGQGRGRLHSMPTANIEPRVGCVLPKEGVWATTVSIKGDPKEYKGMTHIGPRPSVDDNPRITVETLILDFEGDIYGRRISLDFNKFIRPTRKFSNLDELKLQIDSDIAVARNLSI